MLPSEPTIPVAAIGAWSLSSSTDSAIFVPAGTPDVAARKTNRSLDASWFSKCRNDATRCCVTKLFQPAAPLLISHVAESQFVPGGSDTTSGLPDKKNGGLTTEIEQKGW